MNARALLILLLAVMVPAAARADGLAGKLRDSAKAAALSLGYELDAEGPLKNGKGTFARFRKGADVTIYTEVTSGAAGRVRFEGSAVTSDNSSEEQVTRAFNGAFFSRLHMKPEDADFDYDGDMNPLAPPVFEAIKANDAARLAQLLRSRPGAVRFTSPDGSRPLHEARSGEIARLLLDAGADVYSTDGNYLFPLLWAARHEARDVALALLKAGADPNRAGELGGDPPLWVAAGNGDLELVNALLAARGEVDASYGEDEDTPLSKAARNGHVEVAKALLARGADVNKVNGSGNSPLWNAVDGRNLELVELLLARGAKVDVKGRLGTPVARAAYYGDLDMIRLLVRRKVDVNAVDAQGHDTLYWAQRNSSLDPSRKEATLALLRESGVAAPAATVASTGQAPATGDKPLSEEEKAANQAAVAANLRRNLGASYRGGDAPPSPLEARLIEQSRRAALALGYSVIEEGTRAGAHFARYKFAGLTLSTESITRSDGSVRFTGEIGAPSNETRAEAIYRFRSVLLKLMNVQSARQGGFELDGNIAE